MYVHPNGSVDTSVEEDALPTVVIDLWFDQCSLSPDNTQEVFEVDEFVEALWTFALTTRTAVQPDTSQNADIISVDRRSVYEMFLWTSDHSGMAANSKPNEKLEARWSWD